MRKEGAQGTGDHSDGNVCLEHATRVVEYLEASPRVKYSEITYLILLR